MPAQHKYRPQHLALAIALALGYAEFSIARQLPAEIGPSGVTDVIQQPDAQAQMDPLARLQAFIKADDTTVKVVDTPNVEVEEKKVNDLIIIRNGGSIKGQANGGGGINVIQLDASNGGTLGETRNFAGLYNSQGSWTLTSKADFKEGVVVLNDGILTNEGTVLGGVITVGQLFNKGEIKGHVDIAEGGTFAGAGTIGSLEVHGLVNVNGLHGAPEVKGDLSFAKTGVLSYEITPEGRGETIKVDGTASLGDATLKIVAVPGEYPQTSQHTIVEAKKVEGQFGKVLNDLAFMTPALQYNKTNVGLTYARNDVAVESLATTTNAREFAQSIEDPQIVQPAQTQAGIETAAASVTTASAALTDSKPAPPTNAAVNALLGTNKTTASYALERLTGAEIANLAKATLNSDSPVSTSMLSAMRQLDSASGHSNLRERNNAPRLAIGSDDNGRVWLQTLGHGGKLDRDVDPLQHSTKGLLLGADWGFDEEWRLGVMGGKSRTRLNGSELEGDLDSWHLGAYALRQSGPMSLRLGATYSSHDGTTARQIAFAGFNDRPKGRYDTSTQQTFAEVGYNLGRANISIEPFASLGFQRYQRDGYTEKGGAAALKVQAQAQSNMSSTFGLRLAKLNILDNGMQLTPRFSAGWKHTYGDVYTSTRQRLVTGGKNYTVYGAELDRNSLLLDAGLDLGFAANHTVGVGVTGEIGSDSRSHGLIGQWRMAF